MHEESVCGYSAQIWRLSATFLAKTCQMRLNEPTPFLKGNVAEITWNY